MKLKIILVFLIFTMYIHCIYILKIIILTTKIQKWGNSLALRIPKSYAQEANLEEGASVDIKVEENNIIISAKKKKKNKYSLEELLSDIKPENLHGEIDFGPPVGKEIIE